MPASLAPAPGQALDLIARTLSAVDDLTTLISQAQAAPANTAFIDAIVIAAATIREIRGPLKAAELTAEVLAAAKRHEDAARAEEYARGFRDGAAATPGRRQGRGGLHLVSAG